MTDFRDNLDILLLQWEWLPDRAASLLILLPVPFVAHALQQAMRQLFAKSDENVDGKLDSGEITSVLDTLGASSDDNSLTSDKVIEAFDSDGNGQVTGTEFDAGFRKLAENMQGTMIAMQEGAGAERPKGPTGPAAGSVLG